jgi:hypothetical protein
MVELPLGNRGRRRKKMTLKEALEKKIRGLGGEVLEDNPNLGVIRVRVRGSRYALVLDPHEDRAIVTEDDVFGHYLWDLGAHYAPKYWRAIEIPENSPYPPPLWAREAIDTWLKQ